MTDRKGYMRPMPLKWPHPLHKRVKRYCELISEAREQFYSINQFVREAVEEKLNKVERKRVVRRG